MSVNKDECDVVGKNLPRIDALTKVRGEAKYVSDIKVPGMLCGKILRSPLAHARVLNIDSTCAECLHGVKAVITYKDTLKKVFGVNMRTANNLLLQNEKVRYVGDQVGAVAAVDEEIALEALSLIKVDYEELPGVFNPFEAMKPGAPKIHKEENNIALSASRSFGDIERGFAQSDFIVEDEFYSPPIAHCCLEPRGCMASVDASGRLTVWSTTQTPHPLREELSDVLGIPMAGIRVIQQFMGGGFGSRMGMDPIDGIACLLSLKTGKPVRIVNTRDEEFLSSRIRYPMWIWLKTGVKRNGRLHVRQVNIITDNGAYNMEGDSVMGNAIGKIAQLYAIPNVKYEGKLVYTNNVYGGPCRGYGNPQITYAIEIQMDKIAEILNMDPAEIRLMNANDPNSTTVSGLQITSCGLKDCIREVVEISGWKGKRSKKPGQQLSIRRGIGMATMIHGGAGVKFFWGDNCNFSASTVKLNSDGTADLFTGSAELGQGSNTVLAMIAAEELGLKLEDINITNGDTLITPSCRGAWASRQTFTAGLAVKLACQDAKRQLFEFAGYLLEANPEDLVAKGRSIFVKENPSKSIPIAKATSEAYFNMGTPIIGKGVNSDPWSSKPDPKTGYGNPTSAYAFATQAAEVEVDTQTGYVKVLNMYCAHDVGKAINPLMAECQIEGGVLSMGMGYALTEKLIMENGEVKNRNFTDYRIMTMADSCNVHTILVETIDPRGPFGAKGVGEPAMIPTAAAIANAIYNAVGVWILDLPITPEKVVKAIKNKQELKVV